MFVASKSFLPLSGNAFVPAGSMFLADMKSSVGSLTESNVFR